MVRNLRYPHGSVDRSAVALLGFLARMPQLNAALPEPERDVLALLATADLDYEDAAAVLGIDAAAVAELGGAGRMRIARSLGIACGRVPDEAGHPGLGELSAVLDGDERRAGHARDCAPCRSALSAMRAADRIYRSWAMVPMPDELRRELSMRLRFAAAEAAR